MAARCRSRERCRDDARRAARPEHRAGAGARGRVQTRAYPICRNAAGDYSKPSSFTRDTAKMPRQSPREPRMAARERARRDNGDVEPPGLAGGQQRCLTDDKTKEPPSGKTMTTQLAVMMMVTMSTKPAGEPSPRTLPEALVGVDEEQSHPDIIQPVPLSAPRWAPNVIVVKQHMPWDGLSWGRTYTGGSGGGKAR
jgi:hypothetical protein